MSQSPKIVPFCNTHYKYIRCCCHLSMNLSPLVIFTSLTVTVGVVISTHRATNHICLLIPLCCNSRWLWSTTGLQCRETGGGDLPVAGASVITLQWHLFTAGFLINKKQYDKIAYSSWIHLQIPWLHLWSFRKSHKWFTKKKLPGSTSAPPGSQTGCDSVLTLLPLACQRLDDSNDPHWRTFWKCRK